MELQLFKLLASVAAKIASKPPYFTRSGYGCSWLGFSRNISCNKILPRFTEFNSIR